MDIDTQKTVNLSIGGMSCSGCANTVQTALSNIEGVKEATVDLEDESAKISFNPDVAGQIAFEQAIDEAGYELRS